MTKCFEAILACKAAQICFIESVLKLILMHFSKCVKRILSAEVFIQITHQTQSKRFYSLAYKNNFCLFSKMP